MYISAFVNSVEPDQMNSDDAIWSGSAMFAIQFVSLRMYMNSFM